LLTAVVGLLAGAFYDPAWAGVLLVRLKLPPWLMILLAADAGYGLGLF
jgi:hypothetical protein